MTDRRDSPDISDKMLPNDPIESTEPADPTLPILSTDPTLAIDRHEFVDPRLKTEPRERKLRIDDEVWTSRVMGIMVTAVRNS